MLNLSDLDPSHMDGSESVNYSFPVFLFKLSLAFSALNNTLEIIP